MAKRGSSWDDVKLPKFSPLKRDIEVDVTIIGGGITGITCAYLLSKEGKKVAIVERDTLCNGATGATTAFLSKNIDSSLSQLIHMFGKETTRFISDSHQDAIENIEKIIKNNKISCEFMRCNNYSYATRLKDVDYLKEELKTAKSLDIQTEFRDNHLRFENYGYLMIKNQAKFHPLKYLKGLIRVISKKVKIFEKTEVNSISKNDFYITKTNRGNVKSRSIIVATYAPFDNKLFFKKATYRSYVMELQIPKNVLPEGIYEDMLSPYHYFRVDRKGHYDRVIIGGEDHRNDIPVSENKSFHALQDYIDMIFPKIKYKITRMWYGPIMESVDGLAYIGSLHDKNVYYATGFSGNGITYSYIAANIITQSILGKMDKKTRNFASVYKSNRWYNIKDVVYKANDYVAEFFGGAVKNTIKYIGM